MNELEKIDADGRFKIAFCKYCDHVFVISTCMPIAEYDQDIVKDFSEAADNGCRIGIFSNEEAQEILSRNPHPDSGCPKNPGQLKVTIEINKSTLDFLTELATEMKNQDNRITATPYVYQLRVSEKKSCHPDLTDDFIFIDGGKDDIGDIKDLRAYLEYNYKDHKEINVRAYSDDDLEELADKLGVIKFDYQKIEVTKNTFFTKKALDTHVKQNAYHYPEDAYDFVERYWRNPEMENVLKAIQEITNIYFWK